MRRPWRTETTASLTGFPVSPSRTITATSFRVGAGFGLTWTGRGLVVFGAAAWFELPHAARSPTRAIPAPVAATPQRRTRPGYPPLFTADAAGPRGSRASAPRPDVAPRRRS